MDKRTVYVDGYVFCDTEPYKGCKQAVLCDPQELAEIEAKAATVDKLTEIAEQRVSMLIDYSGRTKKPSRTLLRKRGSGDG